MAHRYPKSFVFRLAVICGHTSFDPRLGAPAARSLSSSLYLHVLVVRAVASVRTRRRYLRWKLPGNCGARSQPAIPAIDSRSEGGYIGNLVVTNKTLDYIFGALADATRRGILARLAHGDASVGELARPFRVSRPAISKHLRVLERAKLVRRTREGRISRCHLDAASMRDAAAWVERYRKFWEGQLNQLARYMEQD